MSTPSTPQNANPGILRRAGWLASCKKALCDQWKDLEGPYVVIYGITAKSLPRFTSDFDVAKFNGLSFCHLIPSASDESSKLLLYWKSKNRFEQNQQNIQADLSLPDLEFQGSLSDFKIPKPPLLMRLSLKDWIITASGVLSAATLLYTAGFGLVESAKTEVVFTDNAPLNIPTKQPFSIAVNIVNADRSHRETVSEISGTLELQPTQNPQDMPEGTVTSSVPKTIKIAPDQDSLPSLAVDESKKVTFAGTLPVLDPPDGPPATYGINVALTASAGELREKQHPYFKKSDIIRVWPAGIGHSKAHILQGQGGKTGDKTAMFLTTLYPGLTLPSAEGVIMVTSAPDEISKIEAADLECELPTSPVSPDGQVIHEIGFHHKSSLQQFHPVELTFRLSSSKPLTEDQWKKIEGEIEISAQSEAKGGTVCQPGTN